MNPVHSAMSPRQVIRVVKASANERSYREEPGRQGRHERPAAKMMYVVSVGIELCVLDLLSRRVDRQMDWPAAVPLDTVNIQPLCTLEFQ